MAPFKSGAGRNLGKLIKSYRTFNVGDSFPQAPRPFTASGGNYVLTPGNGYTYHTFTSSGAFVSDGSPKNVEFMLVAGGGGGGGCNNSASGGGGGGGMVISSGFACSTGAHPITVGAGGAGQAGDSLGTVNPGGDSVFTYVGTNAETFTAKGGGGGDGPQGDSGDPGGSGGGFGGTATQPSQNPGISHITNYGNAAPSNGGGGAGAAGGASPDVGGDGQPAPGYEYPLVLTPSLATPLEPYSPTNNHYAGGGGGYPSSTNSLGGGGLGLSSDGGNGNSGIDLLGGGGGFAWYPTEATGGTGGDGIVVIRYRV